MLLALIHIGRCRRLLKLGWRGWWWGATLGGGSLRGGGAWVAGVAWIGAAAAEWQRLDFGHLDYPSTLRQVVPGVTLAALGIQAILSSFFVSMLGMGRR